MSDPEDKCRCDPGWPGINCNVCETDDVRGALVDQPVCFKGLVPRKESFQSCIVKNKELQFGSRTTEITMRCERNGNSGQCQVQVWIDQRESFHCRLEDCNFKNTPEKINADINGPKPLHNISETVCARIKCDCIEGELLCGKSVEGLIIDLEGSFDSEITGPVYLKCNDGGFDGGRYNCELEEPGLLDLLGPEISGRGIELQCNAGECIPRWTLLPEKENHSSLKLASVAMGLILIIYAAYILARQPWKRMNKKLRV